MQNRNTAVLENLKALRALALEIGSKADEAITCMHEENRNGAIGTLCTAERAAEAIEPLWKSIMALHILPENDSQF